jgi:hypothetical protein
MVHLLDAPIRYWRCPSCQTIDSTRQTGHYSRMHSCPGLGNITVPLVEVATPDTEPDARHVFVEREDYAINPDVNRIAAISTRHGSGRIDCTVLAPTARMSSAAHNV